MKLEKPIVFFDLETTGTDISMDRIVEIAALKVYPDGSAKSTCHRVNPLIPISQGASDVHGITNEDVRDCPTFKHLAKSLASDSWIGGSDIGGYNSNRFDIPLLIEEFNRVGVPVDLTDSRFIDVYKIFIKHEERTLSAAYRFYCGKELEGAHSAEADTMATWEILQAQVEKYNLPKSISELADIYDDVKRVDFAGRFTLSDEGEFLFNFGKYNGEPVVEVLKKNPGYYSWMLAGSFTSDTKQWLKKICLIKGVKV